GLRHLEIYTMKGLITILWHGPPDLPAAVVACGGAMGGLLGPAGGLYQRLGEQLPAMGIGVVRLSYRQPNDIPKCTLDLAAGVQDAVLPVEPAPVVRESAECGELAVLPNDGHALAKSGPVLEERLLEWLPAVLGQANR